MSAELLLPPDAENPAASISATLVAPAQTSPGRGRAGSDWVAWLTRPAGVLLVLLAAVFAIYLPTLNGQFLWDDNALVKGNLLIRSPLFCGEVFRHTLFGDESNFYRPTQTLTFIVDYWFSGLNPFGYHLTSVLIHAANAVLLCLVLRRVLPSLVAGALDRKRTELLALGVALVWAVHPVHSAAVAYISGTADTLAMLFCLSAALLCDHALRATCALPRALFGAGALLGLLLGLCAKEIASVWLGLFLGYLFLGRPETSRRACWWVVAGAALALVAYLSLRHLPPPPTPPPPAPKLPPRGVLMLRALGDYGSLLVFPKALFMERQVFAAPGLANSQDEWFYHTLFFDGILLLLTFGVGVWWPGRGRRLRRAGAAWFLAGFLPISNLIPLNASVAEHWLYLPSVGFLLFLAGVGLDALPPLWRDRRTALGLTAAGVLAVGALGLRTWDRTFDWTDELTFFRQTIADGGDVPRARAGLAAAYGKQAVDGQKAGADDRGIAVLREVVGHYPRVAASRINLATALARRGNLAEARSLLEATAADLFAQPRGGDPREWVTTVKALDLLKKDDPAWPAARRSLLSRGLQRHSNAWDLVQFVIQDRARAGDLPGALTLARRFAEARWWHGPAWVAYAQLEARTGQPERALAIWEQASRLDVHDAEAFSDAAMLCLRQDRLGEARRFQERAVRRQPDSPRQHVLLAQVLGKSGNAEAARVEIATARSLVDAAEQSE